MPRYSRYIYIISRASVIHNYLSRGFHIVSSIRGRKNARASPLRIHAPTPDATHDRHFHLRSVSPILFRTSWSYPPISHGNTSSLYPFHTRVVDPVRVSPVSYASGGSESVDRPIVYGNRSVVIVRIIRMEISWKRR